MDKGNMRTELDRLVKKFGYQEITNKDASAADVSEVTLLYACASGAARLTGEWPHLNLRRYQVFA
jgi:hypothetical protein